MEIKQLADLIKAAKRTAMPSISGPDDDAKIETDLSSDPEFVTFFNEFGRMYAEATVPGIAELDLMYQKAARYDVIMSKPSGL